MNHLMLAGHMGSDPEVRYTSSGLKVTTFRLATNSRKAGKEETIWWRITLWGDQFDKLMPHLKKGSAIIVHGEMTKAEIYNNREGQPQMSLNVTANTINFSPFGKGSGGQQGQGQQQGQQSSAPAFNQPPTQNEESSYFYDQSMQGQGAQAPAGSISDEEIPF
ncbi:MAG: single-stranded DNA-binding protein [Simkaniaceae bacterium]|nr:single-stranded DNA-binding protein [Simkaniaceae bacterium]